ncbi:hypothetical protein [Escherichia coli]|uniref:hypothetical protein n=2 Tax=Escherichia coli TaxID=562 RepID=UPI0020221068|nr:hypothetical protein [Escherichia coli]
MAYAFHHALSDSSPGADEVEEIKAGLRAAFANVTAQPEPVVPDEMDLLTCHLDGVTETYADGWNACRAAMLHGAEPVNQTYKSPHKQFEQVADLYEMQFADGSTCTFHTDAQRAAQWLQVFDGNRVQEYVKLERLQNALSGNSPVTPGRLPGGFTIEDAKELHENLVRSHISQALSGEKMKKKDRDADLRWIHGVIVQAAWFVKASLDALPEPLREEKEGSANCTASHGTTDNPPVPGKQTDELTMLVKQLVSQLKKVKPDCKLPDKAMDYLKRNGLISAEDILR